MQRDESVHEFSQQYGEPIRVTVNPEEGWVRVEGARAVSSLFNFKHRIGHGESERTIDDSFTVGVSRFQGDLEIKLWRSDKRPWFHGIMNEVVLNLLTWRKASLYLRFGEKSQLIAEAPHEAELVNLAGPGQTATLPM